MPCYIWDCLFPLNKSSHWLSLGMPALFFTENEWSPRTLPKTTPLASLSPLPHHSTMLLFPRPCVLCLTLCDPMDCSLPGSSVHGISQATRLEWVAISCSRGSSLTRDGICIPLHWQAESLPRNSLASPLFYHRKVWRSKQSVEQVIGLMVHGPFTQ